MKRNANLVAKTARAREWVRKHTVGDVIYVCPIPLQELAVLEGLVEGTDFTLEDSDG